MLISEEIWTALGYFMAPTINRHQGTCHRKDEKVFGGLDGGEGVGSGWVGTEPIR